MTIKVTIGVCARNCRDDVKQIVERILNQDFPHEKMEVLFVEEGSKDETFLEILKIAPTMNLSYKVFHQEWKGLGYSRNIILANALGDYIVWIDDGTILPKDYIRKQVEFLEKNLNFGIARGFVGVYSGSNRVASMQNLCELAFSQKYAGKTIRKRLATSGAVYRVKAAKQVGGFDDLILGAGEDSDISYRILLAGWQIHITQTEFSIKYNKRLKEVWNKSYFYGYGDHFFYHKHKELRQTLYKITPLAGFLEGVLTFSASYKLAQKRIAVLLPIYFFSQRIIWCLGFIKGHLDSYGHL